jgi:hypothetical protein
MPRVGKLPKATLSRAPTAAAEPKPTPVRPVDAPTPPGTPLLIWLDAYTYAAFRQSAFHDNLCQVRRGGRSNGSSRLTLPNVS